MQKTQLLDFESRNNDSVETVLLIHGGGVSGCDWDLVEPYLRSYHLLLPSLFTNASLELARYRPIVGKANEADWQARYVECLASLIRSNAKSGRAHIVGASLGGCFALALVAKYPELSSSLLVSGLPRLRAPPSRFLRPLIVTGLWASERAIGLMGPNMVSRVLDGKVKPQPGDLDGDGTNG
jgi:pimeloyl-ACP methyl ester carboxylesterase